MEHAGSSETTEDAERKGLGTPATRAAIIEKLVEKGFIERKKKQILPTADGRNLIRILPEMIKSPKLTAEWENDLTLISRGQKNAEEFLSGIEKMVTKLVSNNGQPVEEYQKLFLDDRKEIGKCPRCCRKRDSIRDIPCVRTWEITFRAVTATTSRCISILPNKLLT